MRRLLLVVLLVMGPAEAGRYIGPAEARRYAVSAQTPAAPQEGFVPVDDTANQEQLPAAPLVAAAYGVAWAAVLIYVWFLWRRLATVERELSAVSRRMGPARSASGAEWAEGPAERSEPGGVQGAPPIKK